MENHYNPAEIEKLCRQQWSKKGLSQQKHAGESYCIMLPPPNVTGNLHMGHGFQQTLMDVLIRYRQLCGNNVHWQVGTDHAGIATQMVVERQCQKDNLSRHSLGREAFLDRVWDWKARSGGTITQQMRRFGLHVDWSHERFTMDEQLSHSTREAFIRLFEDKLIYRGKRLVNWDPTLKTALSDLEVNNEERQGNLWQIQYPLTDDENTFISIATTRPETLLGDMALAVHPEDERYQNLIGKTCRLPLCDRDIPIISDDSVDQEFGTGCLKITPAHDFNDYEVGKRHGLDSFNIMTEEACIKRHMKIPKAYHGLTREAARKAVVADLEAAGLLESVTPHKLAVPIGERSGAVLEPRLTEQWYVKMAALAEPALAAANKGQLNFFPSNWQKTYNLWLEGIQDWCISRQLWWGHRIPVWYDNRNNAYAGHGEADVRQRYQIPSETALRQDEDVLDTWFSSSLWPFATLGWPEKTDLFEQYFPTQTLVTGFDIIFFWVARMVMMSLYFTGKIPFKNLVITGLIRDNNGDKMSKTKGNVIDPIDLIDGISQPDLIEKRIRALINPKQSEKIRKETIKNFPDGMPAFGCDALRFTYCALASTGRDIKFDLGRIEGYRNYCNKLWNATRFVLMQVGEEAYDQPDLTQIGSADKWMLHRLNTVIDETHNALTQHRFDNLAQLLYEFVWHDYCDWYLEITKARLLNPHVSEESKIASRATLLHILSQILILHHPLTPFITDALWQAIQPAFTPTQQTETIIEATYPSTDKKHHFPDAVAAIETLKHVATAIRTLRSEVGISPAIKIPVRLFTRNTGTRAALIPLAHTLMHLAGAKQVEWLEEADLGLGFASTQADDTIITIPLSGLIDRDKELARTTKQYDKAMKDMQKIESKLSNPRYCNNAPKDIVEAERAKLRAAQENLARLERHKQNIEAMA